MAKKTKYLQVVSAGKPVGYAKHDFVADMAKGQRDMAREAAGLKRSIQKGIDEVFRKHKKYSKL